MGEPRPRRILFVNPFGLGDVLFCLPLVEAVRAALPDAFIGFVCNERTAPLVRLAPSIDHSYIFNRDRFRKLWKRHPLLFLKKLRAYTGMIAAERFDTMIDLSLARQYSLAAMLLGIRRRVGFDYKGRGIFLSDKLPLEGYRARPVWQEALGLAPLLGVEVPDAPPAPPLFVSEDARRETAAFLKQKGIGPDERILCVAPGGGRSWGKDAIYKQWAPERFAAAADGFSRGRKWRVILLGDEGERALLDETARGLSGKPLVLAGEPIERVAACLLRSELLLCNDGGPLHLAHALGVKTVGIYGPVDERVYGPGHGRAPAEVVTEAVACRPCYRDFRFPPCEHERRCLEDISVRKVLAAMEKIA